MYYAALDLATAVEETRFWPEKLLGESAEPAMFRDMRVYTLQTQPPVGDIVDIRAD